MKTKILVIEDNEQNSYLMKFLLESHGLEVALAPDGPSGLARAAAAPPDLILLDIQLPGMSGHEVAAKIRTLPALAEVPIVAVTSFAMPGDREQCLAAGCNGYIEKPIDPATFVHQLTPWLLRPPEKESTP